MTDISDLREEKIRAEIASLGALTRARDTEAAYNRLRCEAADMEMDGVRFSNFENRHLNFGGLVSDNAAQQFQNTVMQWARQNPLPITVTLDSPGGSVFAGMAIVDTIIWLKQQGINVCVTVRGMAASMGGIILQAADNRIIGENAWLMIHEVTTASIGKTSEMEDNLEFHRRIQDRCLDLLASRSSMSKAEIKTRWERRDWWLTADEAVELGFADVIG